MNAPNSLAVLHAVQNKALESKALEEQTMLQGFNISSNWQIILIFPLKKSD